MLEVPCQRKPNPCTLRIAFVGMVVKGMLAKGRAQCAPL